jgi:hypothetical protein
LYQILNDRFSKDCVLPENYFEAFCKINLEHDTVKQIVKYKQFILQTTGIFPSNYSEKNMIPFMQVLSLSCTRNCYLPRDVMLRIGGCLFRGGTGCPP